MELKELNILPNEKLLTLPNERFKLLFLKMIEEYHTFKGKRFFEAQTLKYVESLYYRTRGKFLNIDCNDIAFIFEQEISNHGFKNLSVEYLLNAITNQSTRKEQQTKQTIFDKTLEKLDPLWGTCVRLRMFNDFGAKRLESGDYTMRQVYESALNGINFYDGEPLVK